MFQANGDKLVTDTRMRHAYGGSSAELDSSVSQPASLDRGQGSTYRFTRGSRLLLSPGVQSIIAHFDRDPEFSVDSGSTLRSTPVCLSIHSGLPLDSSGNPLSQSLRESTPVFASGFYLFLRPVWPTYAVPHGSFWLRSDRESACLSAFLGSPTTTSHKSQLVAFALSSQYTASSLNRRLHYTLHLLPRETL